MNFRFSFQDKIITPAQAQSIVDIKTDFARTSRSSSITPEGTIIFKSDLQPKVREIKPTVTSDPEQQRRKNGDVVKISEHDFAESVLDAHNLYRTNHGVPHLTLSEEVPKHPPGIFRFVSFEFFLGKIMKSYQIFFFAQFHDFFL